MNPELIKQIEKLVLSASASGGAKKKKKKKKSAATGGNPAGLTLPIASTSVSKSAKKKAKRKALNSGEVSISRTEYLAELTTGADGVVKGQYRLEPKTFSWLANVSKAFELYKWQSLSFEYRPAVGANTDGMFAMAVDWGKATLGDNFTRGDLFSLTPSVDTPVWQPTKPRNFALPRNKLQTREWYEVSVDPNDNANTLDRQPGSLAVHAKSSANKVIGEIWVTYSVTLSGTRKV